MRRTGKRSVALAAVVTALAWSGTAAAFHATNVFDKPPGAGGAGGIFYVGAAREKGWNCTACHRDPAGKIKIVLAAPEAPQLLQSFRYETGKTYALEARLDGEHRGAGPSNFNSIVVSFVGVDGGPAGEISGFAADEFYASGRATIGSAGQRPNENRWSFRWTAPSAVAGPIKIHIGAVDGNGADGLGGGTLTDPWGDDVFVGTLVLDPPVIGVRTMPVIFDQERRLPDREGGAGLALGFALAISFGLRRGGRR